MEERGKRETKRKGISISLHANLAAPFSDGMGGGRREDGIGTRKEREAKRSLSPSSCLTGVIWLYNQKNI